MTNKNEHTEHTKSNIAMLHIPIKIVVIGAILVAVVYFVLLITTGKNRTRYKQVRLTATQQWMDVADTQTRVAQNGQGTATQVAFAVKTPTPTATLPSDTPTPTFTETPILLMGSTQDSPMDGMTMMYVPEGKFMMGDNGADATSKPEHEVYLDAFWIDQTEISNGMYAKCVTAGICSEPASKKSTNLSDYYGNSEYDNYPVIYVSWLQAKDYCEYVGRQLPTEAQWEKAALGTDGRKFPWGDSIEDYSGNFSPLKNGYRPVRSYPEGASPYGALQMSGNVYEWVADWFDKAYYLSQESWMNPTGPADAEQRSVRGGKFYITYEDRNKTIKGQWRIIHEEIEITENFSSTFRMSWKPDGVSHLIGFRCAANAP
jgi:formylglycine-generating enzyme required for sulfatase activity